MVMSTPTYDGCDVISILRLPQAEANMHRRRQIAQYKYHYNIKIYAVLKIISDHWVFIRPFLIKT